MEGQRGAEGRTGFLAASRGTWHLSPGPRPHLPPSPPQTPPRPRASALTFIYSAPWKPLRFQGFPQSLRGGHCRQINVRALSVTSFISPLPMKRWHSRQRTVSRRKLSPEKRNSGLSYLILSRPMNWFF